MGIVTISGGHALTVSRGPSFMVKPPANAYLNLILASSPLGVWLLDETSGTTAVDNGSGGLPGTYMGPAYRLNEPSIVSGLGSTAFIRNRAFNQGQTEGSGLSDTHVEILDNVAGGHAFTTISDATDEFTIEAWIQTGVYDTDYEAGERPGQTIISMATNGDPTLRVAFSFGISEGTLSFCRRRGGTSERLNGIADLSDNQIHHVVVTVNNSTRQVRFYIDGVLDVQRTFGIGFNGTDTSMGSSAAALIIGAHQRSAGGRDHSGWTGFLGGVAVYPSILSDPTILAHYNAGTGQSDVASRTTLATEIAADSPILWYKLNETPIATTVAVDSGSNADNATYVYPGGTLNKELQVPAPELEVDTAFRTGFSNSHIELFRNQAGGHSWTTFGDTSFTIMFWMYHTATFINGSLWYPGRTAIELRQQGSAAGTVIPFSCGFDQGAGGSAFGKMMIGFSDDYTTNDDRLFSNEDVVSRYTAHHCAYVVTISGGGPFTRSVEFFVDGVSVGTDSNNSIGSTQMGANAGSLVMGVRTTNAGAIATNGVFQGVISNLAVFPTAVSSARILAHYNAGVAA